MHMNAISICFFLVHMSKVNSNGTTVLLQGILLPLHDSPDCFMETWLYNSHRKFSQLKYCSLPRKIDL